MNPEEILQFRQGIASLARAQSGIADILTDIMRRLEMIEATLARTEGREK